MPLRNASRTDRRALAVVSDLVGVQGAGAAPRRLTGGRFLGRPVELGEILTDGDGRLLVLPGSGRAVSASDAPALSGFADNDSRNTPARPAASFRAAATRSAPKFRRRKPPSGSATVRDHHDASGFAVAAPAAAPAEAGALAAGAPVKPCV